MSSSNQKKSNSGKKTSPNNSSKKKFNNSLNIEQDSAKKSSISLETQSNQSSKEKFLETMSKLVSNDKETREEGMDEVINLLKIKFSNPHKIYKKIWESIFASYFNVDKRDYQFFMANKISDLILNSNKDNTNNDLITFHEIWIKEFLYVFMNKLQTIDNLRMDKYIFLINQITSTYFENCFKLKLYNSLLEFLNSLLTKDTEETRDVTFLNVIFSVIGDFINLLFNNNSNKSEFNEAQIKDYLKNNFIIFLNKLNLIYQKVTDERSIKTFNENILIKLYEKINESDDKCLKEKIQTMYTEFLNKGLNSKKHLFLQNFLNKLEGKNHEELEDPFDNKNKLKNSIDPVNDYILERNYTQNFKKTKSEIKTEKIKREKEEKLNKTMEKEENKSNKKSEKKESKEEASKSEKKSEKKESKSEKTSKSDKKSEKKESKSEKKESKSEKTSKSDKKSDKKEDKNNKIKNESSKISNDKTNKDKSSSKKEDSKSNEKEMFNNLNSIAKKLDSDLSKVEVKVEECIATPNKDDKNKENLTNNKNAENKSNSKDKKSPKIQDKNSGKSSDKKNDKKNKQNSSLEKKKKQSNTSDDSLVEDEDSEIMEKDDIDDDDDDSENFISDSKNNSSNKQKETIEEDEDDYPWEGEIIDDEDEDEEEEIEEIDLDDYEERLLQLPKNTIEPSVQKNTIINRDLNIANSFIGKKRNNKEKAAFKKHKNRIKFTLENNATCIYDSKKPIILSSKKKNVLPKGPSPLKPLLRKEGI